MIESVKIYHLQIPFKFGYDHAQASRMTSDSVLVGLTFKDGKEYFGECAPRLYVTGESLETVKFALEKRKKLITSFNGNLDSLQEIVDQWGDEDPAALCAVENALLQVITPKEVLPTSEKNLIYSATITGGSRPAFEKMAQLFAMNQMREVKIKLVDDLQENLSRIEFIRALYQGNVEIRVDGNEIWTFDQHVNSLEALIKSGIKEFEQPFAKGDHDSCRQFRKAFGKDAQLILDDSITTKSSFDFHLENELMDGINIKISKNGGYFKSLKLAQKAKEHGLSVQLGAHVGETSLLAYFGALFAFHPDLDLKHCEGAFSTHLLESDPVTPHVQFGQGGVLKEIPDRLTVQPGIPALDQITL